MPIPHYKELNIQIRLQWIDLFTCSLLKTKINALCKILHTKIMMLALIQMTLMKWMKWMEFMKFHFLIIDMIVLQ
jgi:hypothetical protein